MTAQVMRALFESLDRREKPEDVLRLVQQLLEDDLSEQEKKSIQKALLHSIRSNPWGYSSMSADFRRPPLPLRSLKVASELFSTPGVLPAQAGDLPVLDQYLENAGQEIQKEVGQNDFLHDRLNREGRLEAGLDLSKRQYNKRFRLLKRLEKKRQKLEKEQEKRQLTLISKARLAAEISFEDFGKDPNTAAFIAYLTARHYTRSVFTNTAQQRPYDEIADLLFRRCCNSATTQWWPISWVYPDEEVLSHLTEEQKGLLLGKYFRVLERTALLMQEVWHRSNISRNTMIVRRGNDSSTWNLLAGAWNRCRDGWMNVLYALNMDGVLDSVCPGKALRLMAADVAAWHRNTGGGLDPNTAVWNLLPLPWEVMSGHATCTRDDVRKVCKDLKLDPEKSGWIAPRAKGKPAPFRPTPELVHGVTVSHPGLALLLRKNGYFSGKPA